MLILLIFLAELAAAILAFIFREHVSCPGFHFTRCSIITQRDSSAPRLVATASCVFRVFSL